MLTLVELICICQNKNTCFLYCAELFLLLIVLHQKLLSSGGFGSRQSNCADVGLGNFEIKLTQTLLT